MSERAVGPEDRAAQRLLTEDLPDAETLRELREALAAGDEPITAARIAEQVRRAGLALGAATTRRLVGRLRDELVGLGPLQRYVDEPGVTDVLVDGRARIWTDGADGLRRRAAALEGEEQARSLARRLIALSGGRLDEGRPCADGRLGDCRIHAVIPPVAVEGTMLSVRVARGAVARMEDLAADWSHREDWLRLIRAVVRRRLNCLISGGTGAGKTALLAAMLAECPADERLVIVEDSAELHPEHPHVVHLQTRRGNAEGAGAVEMGQLVRQTLRMRPDRLIVGECRGAELRDFLAAMNTGHRGAGGTVHANSPEAVPARLEAMGALAEMPPQTVAMQAAAALDLVIHVERRGPHRRPAAASQVVWADGKLGMTPVLRQDGEVLRRGPGWQKLVGDEPDESDTRDGQDAVRWCGERKAETDG
ncbi:TadA family conjugal transfer-associated ATPase [Nesterenkonia halophila]|uniref:TadA family conjugal transfer-associated ATPase n=1 Tax=Nesterenkonia halophila TaxID=302044 RepID=UPI00129196A9|nr:TadA family conjugal transfer-associated ATPase [Nesterenkonia halophila]